jgi:glycosyltransferase involved in cell wall biosynthesis
VKIVHVLPALVKGGGERVVVDLANHQAAAGEEVTVIAGVDADHALLRSALSGDVTVKTLVDLGGSLRSAYLRTPGWIWRNRSWLREQDVLHCHLTFGSLFGSVTKTMRNRLGWERPLIVETYHAVGMPIPAHHRWIHATLASERDGLALMAADSYWNRFAAVRPLQLVRQIQNGVDAHVGRQGDPAQRMAWRREIGIPDSCELVAGTVGQFRDDRQPWLFVPLFAEIAAALGDRVHFVMAGAGPALERVRAAVAEHGLEGRVHFPGQVASAGPSVAIMDLYITLAVGPVVGLAALEAAFAGVPVIAIQLRHDYICPATDWVWSNQRVPAVAKKAIELLGNPAHLEAVTTRQHEFALSRHSVTAMANAYRQLYADAAINRDANRRARTR